jgi:cell volume regulation protein A
MSDHRLLLVVGAMLAVGVAASLLAGRVRVPALILLLAMGMVVGSDVTGWVSFEDYELARTVGIVALSLILFEGGLASGFEEIRPVLGASISLAVFGTLGTAIITGLAAAWLFDLSVLEGMLLGAIVSATDGAAVFAVLRGSRLRRRVARTLEGEAGMNDPVAVLLVIGFIEWLQRPDYGVANLAVLLGAELVIGAAAGLAVGGLAARALGRIRLASAGLYPVASVATAALAYGVAEEIHGSGFLAVYLAGLVLGSVPTPARRTVTTFHDGLAWVAQLGMFFTLGLLVFPSQLDEVAVEGTVLALVIALVARPISIAAAIAPFRFSAQERVVLGWAGLRGAVPVVLATFPLIEGVPRSLEFFNIVFFAVVLSTIVQGATFEPLARALGVTTSEAALPSPLAQPATMRRLGAEIVEFVVGERDAAAGRYVRELGMPRDALLNVIVRGEQAIPPRGSTLIEPGDRLHVLVRQEAALEFHDLLDRWRSGPIGPPPRPRPVGRGAPAIFSTGPWPAADGDAGHPSAVLGITCVEQLRTRRDVPGALVVLADGRLAFTGPIYAVGSAPAVQAEARRRLRHATTASEEAWWREVVGALAEPA